MCLFILDDLQKKPCLQLTKLTVPWQLGPNCFDRNSSPLCWSGHDGFPGWLRSNSSWLCHMACISEEGTKKRKEKMDPPTRPVCLVAHHKFTDISDGSMTFVAMIFPNESVGINTMPTRDSTCKKYKWQQCYDVVLRLLQSLQQLCFPTILCF